VAAHRERERERMDSLACFVVLCASFGAAKGVYGRVGAAVESVESRRMRLHTDGSRGAAHAWPGYLYTRAIGRCTPQ
jgi:hypothetical protein